MTMLDEFPERLTREEAAALAERAISALGPEVSRMLAKASFSPTDMILFMPVAKKFEATRKTLGLTVKEVSKEVRVPQYRLRAIETASLRELRSDAATRYAEFLNLTDWYQDWCADNDDFVAEYGLAAD